MHNVHTRLFQFKFLMLAYHFMLLFLSLESLAFKHINLCQFSLWQRIKSNVFSVSLTIKAIFFVNHMLTVYLTAQFRVVV
jgi:hypothetical protein